MEVSNSSSETAVQSQTSAAAAGRTTVELENQSSSMREMDDSELVGGVPTTAVIGLPAAAESPATVPAAAVEVKSVAVGTARQQVMIEKKKRGRPARGLGQGPRPPPAKMSREEEEDVCFICFDGGSLVLCDRKGCPKAYHPACIKRDEAFFQSKAKWNCGWHICSVCQKASYHLCYTCTYSLCKGCARGAEFVSVRGNKGFCTICVKTIMMIENKDTGSKESVQVDFDDKSSWEYLFKVYWVCLKDRLSLTFDELIKAKNPLQGLIPLDNKQQAPDKINSIQGAVVSVSGDSSKELQVPNEQPELPSQDSISPEKPSSDRSTTLNGCVEWASRELLEFVAHMRNGDTSLLSQFDVQALLLDYIKMNNLRDPRRKSQIICDFRLKNLFGKLRVGHIEMLKLLEYHFLIKEDTLKNSFIPAGIVGNVTTQVGTDYGDDPTSNQNKKRRTWKKVEQREPQTNLDEYAAIDVHNINLIYLRRNLMENLLGDMEKFHDKVVCSIVRIRVSCNDQKHDIYRLVQVVGTGKTAEPYKIGDRTADIMLEVLNLDRKETVSIDGISNQYFSEDECQRLRQSIKCGLVKRFTVGEIQIKAIALQEVRLNDWLELEILRLNHLRDRANEKGRKRELRECVEKLQLLKTPEERQRRLTEIPEVHADPKMNPDYESEDDTAVGEFSRSRHSKFDISGSQAIHPKRRVNEDGPVRTQQLDEKIDMQGPNSCLLHENQVVSGGSSSGWSNQAVVSSGLESSAALSVDSPPIDSSDIEKMWHYRDPNGKVQGPFSMTQLRKWSTTGYFPDDMRIWINNEQNGSILLTDALNGQLYKASLLLHNFSMQSHGSEVGLASRLSVADVRSRFTSGNEGDSKQEGLLQRNDSRVHFSNNHEIARSEGSGPVSSDWTTSAVDKDLLPQRMKPCDLSKSKSSCSDHSPMVSPVQSFNLVPTSISPLNQAKEHKVEEFNSVVDHGKESSLVKAVHHVSGGKDHDKPSSSQSSGGESSGQSCRSIPLNLDLNQKDSGLAASAKPSYSLERNGIDVLGLPSPTPQRFTGQSAEKPDLISLELPLQMAGLSELPSPAPPKPRDEDLPTPMYPINKDLPTHTRNPADADLHSPTPKPAGEGQGGKMVENKRSVPSKIYIQDSGSNVITTASLEVGGSRLREITNEWSGYFSSHAKPSVEGRDSSIASMLSLKQPDAVGDQVAIPNSNDDPVTQSQPAPSVPFWQALFHEPIEFSTLAVESVSDLLAEVDAMESQSGLASPTSGMRYSDERNDCFSSIEELSPTPDAGKSDACSADIQFPSQPTVDDPVGASQVDAFDPLKRSGGHSTSSSESETKSVDAPINQREAGSDIHPSQSIVGGNMARGRGLEIDPGWATAQGNMNMGWGGPPHSFSNMGWGPGMGTPWGNTNYNVGAYNGNVAWDSPRRYGGERFVGSRDWGYQGPDVGYGRARPWSRQQHGGGGGYSRPSPKGQRVCKFYESGHCKKGASCGYLHP